MAMEIPPSKNLVLDSCVCIDLENGRLIPLVFDLSFSFLSTDMVEYKLQDLGKRLKRWVDFSELEPTLVKRLIAVRSEAPRKISTMDLSCFVLAESLHGVLVTNDSRLRHFSESKSLKVHGLLWLLDVMVDQSLMPPSQAACSLQKMLQWNSYLPLSECNKRILVWTHRGQAVSQDRFEERQMMHPSTKESMRPSHLLEGGRCR